MELEAAAKEAEKLLAQISESTFIAEKEKAKVAVIVDSVTTKAQVRAALLPTAQGCACVLQPGCLESDFAVQRWPGSSFSWCHCEDATSAPAVPCSALAVQY